MGRWIIQAGVVIILIGCIVMLLEKAGIRPGRLPGDIRISGRSGTFYFPLMTCLLVSLFLTFVSWLFNRR